jgi:hypothetical protein
MDSKTKQGLLLCLILIILMTALLGLGLPNLKLEAGMPLPERVSSGGPGLSQSGGSGYFLPAIDRMIIGIAIALVALGFLGAVIVILKGMRWKELWRGALKVLLCCAAIFTFISLLYILLPHSSASLGSAELLMPNLQIRQGSLGRGPRILYWILGFVALGGIAFLGYRMLAPKSKTSTGMINVRLEAQAARDALLNGGNFKDVITKCYARMLEALEAERGIERGDAMTAREFEVQLTESGVPSESVRALTSLF